MRHAYLNTTRQAVSRISLARDVKKARGKRLRKLIDELWDGTYASFARALGMDPVSISRLVTGKTDLMKSPNLARIAEALGVSEAELLHPEAGRADMVGLVVKEQSGTYASAEPGRRPLPDELEELIEWLPDDVSRRMARHVAPRLWLGQLYAHAADKAWPKECLDRIDAARRRLDDLDSDTQGGSA